MYDLKLNPVKKYLIMSVLYFYVSDIENKGLLYFYGE